MTPLSFTLLVALIAWIGGQHVFGEEAGENVSRIAL
jgi:hypothetical protein